MRNDKQTRTRFIRQDQEHVEWFEKIYVESNNTIRYVGEWHTHPEDVPHYSSLDMLNWRKIKKYANKSVIHYHIIAGRKALAIWKIMGENRLPVSIGTYLWKDIIDSEKIKLKIIDNIVQILEIAILAISIVIPYLVDFQNIFREYMMKEYPKPENFILLLALNKGNLAISVAFFVFVFLKIRKYNLNCIMCNKNIYHDYSYFWFCFCAKFLGLIIVIWYWFLYGCSLN